MEFWHVVLLLVVFEIAFTIFNREYWFISPTEWYMYAVRAVYAFGVVMSYCNELVWAIPSGVVWAVVGGFASRWLDESLDKLSDGMLGALSVLAALALGIFAVALAYWVMYYVLNMDIYYYDVLYGAFHKGEDQIVSIIYCLFVYVLPLALPVYQQITEESPLRVLGGALASFVLSIVFAFVIMVVYGLIYEIMHMSFGSIFGIVAILAALSVPTVIVVHIFVK